MADEQDGHYRLRLKGNLNVNPGVGDLTTGELAAGHAERSLRDVRLFNHGVPTNLGILHEAGHPEPWMIAMNDPPNRATVHDYASRWGIEPMFSDFKSRGFQLEATQLRAPDRLVSYKISGLPRNCNCGASGGTLEITSSPPQPG